MQYPKQSPSLRSLLPLLMLTACQLPDGVGNLGTPVSVRDVTGASCFKQEFVQQDRGSHKLDLLFVTDTSGSLNTERRAVASGIAQ